MALVTAVGGPGATATAAGPTEVRTGAARTATASAMPAGGVFGPQSVWKTDISAAPVHENSAGMVSTLVDQTASLYGGVAAFNAHNYTTSFFTAAADQPRVDVAWDNCQGKPSTPLGLLGEGGQFTSVPIPDDAVPATGRDGQLTVYSPATDQLWEFWRAKKVDDAWSACWGGRIDGVSSAPGYFRDWFGASATGLSSAGGTIGIRDVESGSIDHAIALQMLAPGNSTEYSYPAQRSDGTDTSDDRVPEGTRFRLDPRVDVDSLKLTAIGKMVARAAQKYGFIVTDRAGCTAVVAESPAAAVAATGVDPWVALKGGKADYQVMKNFPWAQLQALPFDWGKPASFEQSAGGETGGTVPAPVVPPSPVVSADPVDVSDVFTPVRNGYGPAEKDRSNGGRSASDGGALRIAGVVHARGLGVHAGSEVVVPVAGAGVFSAWVGVDDEVGTGGSVVFQVWDGDHLLATSSRKRGGQPAERMVVDVTGVERLRLLVTDAGDGATNDHADWGTPLLWPFSKRLDVSDGPFSVVSSGAAQVGVDVSSRGQESGDRRPMSIAGVAHARGFGVRSRSELVVPTGGAQFLSVSVGVDDEVGSRGSVVFEVWDGDRLLVRTPRMRGGQPARNLTVDVSGSRQLRFVTGDSGDGDANDHADWGTPQLLS